MFIDIHIILSSPNLLTRKLLHLIVILRRLSTYPWYLRKFSCNCLGEDFFGSDVSLFRWHMGHGLENEVFTFITTKWILYMAKLIIFIRYHGDTFINPFFPEQKCELNFHWIILSILFSKGVPSHCQVRTIVLQSSITGPCQS